MSAGLGSDTQLKQTVTPQTRLLRPEGTSFLRVLQIVSDDVRLLEEQAHGVGQLGVVPHLRLLQLGRREQLRQTDAYQPCYVVAILHKRTKQKTFFFFFFPILPIIVLFLLFKLNDRDE